MKVCKMAMMVLALSVSGCTTWDDPNMSTGSIKPVAPTLSADVAPTYAVAYLPRVAGQVEAVRQTSQPDRISQTVLYPNPGYGKGENSVKVTVGQASSSSSFYQAPTRRQLNEEMRQAFPGIQMHVANTVGQNLQGKFGFAIGKSATNGSCIYAWQTTGDLSQPDQRTSLMRKQYGAKIRLRFCHPDMSEEALVSLMNGLRLRDISPATIEMLRFAEGSAVTSRPTYEMAPDRAAVPDQPAAKVSENPVRKMASRVVTVPVKSTSPKAKDPTGETAIRNAAHVFLPDDLKTSKDLKIMAQTQDVGHSADVPLVAQTRPEIDTKPTASIEQTNAAIIPLPDKLNK